MQSWHDSVPGLGHVIVTRETAIKLFDQREFAPGKAVEKSLDCISRETAVHRIEVSADGRTAESPGERAFGLARSGVPPW